VLGLIVNLQKGQYCLPENKMQYYHHDIIQDHRQPTWKSSNALASFSISMCW